ncbi:hypothetical protein QZH41_011274 [Actinostola sp. cb2023]|nr:hypothetical protein QZH41_011274 [Actinostola sp. cb2023]
MPRYEPIKCAHYFKVSESAKDFLVKNNLGDLVSLLVDKNKFETIQDLSFLANDIPMIKAIDMPICYTIKLKRALEGLLTVARKWRTKNVPWHFTFTVPGKLPYRTWHHRRPRGSLSWISMFFYRISVMDFHGFYRISVMDFHGFYRISVMDFHGFYRISVMNFHGFYRISVMDFHGFYMISAIDFHGFYMISVMDFHGFYRISVMDFHVFYRISVMNFHGFYRIFTYYGNH